MSRTAERVLIFGLGALFVPVTQLLAARYAGRHFLDIVAKENQ
jgi:molybdopterin/thiamine biosynthesis adenylyltransferase